MLTQEVSEIDRLLIISELEQVIQSLLIDDTVNVEFEIEDNGNEKVITITTTSTLPGTERTEEAAPIEETEEESGGSSDNGNGGDSNDPEPQPEPEPQPGEVISEVPGVPFG
jgi:hypothetical protein